MGHLFTPLLVAVFFATLVAALDPTPQSPNVVLNTIRYGTFSLETFTIPDLEFRGPGITVTPSNQGEFGLPVTSSTTSPPPSVPPPRTPPPGAPPPAPVAAPPGPAAAPGPTSSLTSSFGPALSSVRSGKAPIPQVARQQRVGDAATLQQMIAAAQTAQSPSSAPPPSPVGVPPADPSRIGAEFFNVATPSARARVLSFDGIDNLDQATAGTGPYFNGSFNLEPPDGGFCVGNGFVIQTVNLAIVIFDESGLQLTIPVPVNQFWQVDPLLFTSDPRCVFDRDTRRFFFSVLSFALDGSSSALLLAVTLGGDPRAGYALYETPTKNDGTDGTPDLTSAGCPCFLDQPKLAIGADVLTFNGFSFPVGPGNAVSSDIYILSKFALAAGDPSIVTPAYVNSPATLVEGNLALPNSARVSPDERYPRDAGGVIYFVSDTDFFCTGARVRQLALFALVHTSALTGPNPDVNRLQLLQSLVDSKIDYNNCQIGLSPFGGLPVTQKNGPRLLGPLLGLPLETLSSNDDAVREPVFAHGNLFVGLNDIVPGDANRPATVGIAWFILKPSVIDAHDNDPVKVTGQVDKAGVIAVQNSNNVIVPAFAINKEGRGVVGFTLSGPDFFPSAAYISFEDRRGPTGDVILMRPGAAPEDGSSAYRIDPASANPTARWGDYFMGTADEKSNLWFSVEYIPDRLRDLGDNWGMAVVRVDADTGSD